MLRVDAARNRAALLAAATRTFATSQGEPSMRAVAREACVGIATLYRHFPTREAMVDAVYHDQVQRLDDGARALLAQHRPPAALRAWMDLFATWRATKHGMLDTLAVMIDSGAIAHAASRAQLLDALDLVLAAGRDTGELRADVGAEDVVAAMVGVLLVAGRPDQHAQAGRLLDLLLDALTVRPA